jgi:hypothetical protein
MIPIHDMDDFPQRIADKIDVTGSCWLWTGAKDYGGYARIAYPFGKRETPVAHKVIYRMLVGEVPEGMQLDHLCRIRHCVNPDHLEPVTAWENAMRSPIHPAYVNSRKTHCPQGHEYAGANLGRCPRKGVRYCKECKRVKAREWGRRKRAEARSRSVGS